MIDTSGLTGVSCPSSTLCVAVDAAGRVLVSTKPAIASAWEIADVDGGNAFSGISCPSTSLCVAVDRAGNVVTSTDPSGGSGAWLVSDVNGSEPLTGVSCASTSLCAAIGSEILVSQAPAGGPTAWTNLGVGGGIYYECQHYGDISPSCDAPPTGISCVSGPLICVSVNDAGEGLASANPISGASSWTGSGPSSGEYLAVSCASSSLCVASCPVGVDAGAGNCNGTAYDAGDVVTWDPLAASQLGTLTTVAPDNLTEIWCLSASLCFATDGQGAPGLFSSNGTGKSNLYVSTNPAGETTAWSVAYTDHDGITGVACPAATCIAVDSAGRLLMGSRPPTAAEIKQSLLKELAPRRLTIHRLASQGRYAFSFDALEAGRLTISWRFGSRNSQSTVIGGLSTNLSNAGVRKLIIKLTAKGKQMLSTSNRLEVTAVGSFAPSGNPTIFASTSFSLRR